MTSLEYYRSVKITIKNELSHYRDAKMWSFILRYVAIIDKIYKITEQLQLEETSGGI